MVKAQFKKMFGAVLIIVAITAVLPEIFTNIDALTEAPAYVTVLLTLVSGLGMVYLAARVIGLA